MHMTGKVKCRSIINRAHVCARRIAQIARSHREEERRQYRLRVTEPAVANKRDTPYIRRQCRLFRATARRCCNIYYRKMRAHA